MTVKTWVKILQKDNKIEKIGLEMDGGEMCKIFDYVDKYDFENSLFSAYSDEEVVQMYYQNAPHHTLLIYEKA